MLGLMLSTWFLSMLMSNTATTAVMMPVAVAVLGQLQNNRKKAENREEGVFVQLTPEEINLTPEGIQETCIGEVAFQFCDMFVASINHYVK